MKLSDIIINCYESYENIFKLQEEWNRLHENSVNPSVYNSFVFINESIQIFNDESVSLKIFTLTDTKTDELIAVFPMQIQKKFWGWLSFNSLETAALNEIMDKPYPVIRQDCHDMCWEAFIKYLKEQVDDWDHFYLRDIPSSYPVLKLLSKLCEEQDLIYKTEFDSNSTEINIEGEWDEFWGKHRSMRRNLNKIERDFGNRLAFTVHESNWEKCLERYIELENKGWKKGLGVTESEQTTEFYRRLCEKLEASGQLSFGFLTVDDQLITATIAYPYGDTVYFPQGCYDPEYRKYSPNMVNLTYLIKHFYETPHKNVDFLCGYADFISKWSDKEIKTYDVNIFRKRPVVKLLHAGEALVKAMDSFGGKLKNTIEKFNNTQPEKVVKE